MADLNYSRENATVQNSPNWGAIWGGVFTFIAIWSVFGSLGLVIFASAAGPGQTTTGINVGMSIWAVVLTIIAMFAAGRVTGRLAGVMNSRDGALHGVIMFGLAVTAALVLVVVGGNAFGPTEINGTVHSAYVLEIFADLGWALFASLFLGMFAALGGAATSHREIPQPAVQGQVRHA
jgi:hypothetical protein